MRDNLKTRRILLNKNRGENMAAETLMAGGPILLGVLIALTNALKWPQWLQYIWAGVAIVFGVVVYLIV